MDLREIGAMLHEERERQGLSLETVSDKIKITCSCLKAIEEGNESSLPHPVYAKGFIKNYAKLLGIDQEEFSQSLAEVYRPEEPALHEGSILQNVAENADMQHPAGASSKFPFPAVAVGIVCLLVLLVAGLGWYYYAHFAHQTEATPVEKTAPETPATPTPQPDPDHPIPTVPPATPSSAEPAPTPASPQSATATPAPTSEDRGTQDIANSGPGAGASPATIPPASSDGAAAPETSPAALTIGENGPHTVTITAKARCWIQAGADGGPMREATLEKGEVFTGRFADNLLVRLGNAGVVDIRFDNKHYPLRATKGSVKTLKFVAKKNEGDAAKTPAKTDIPSSDATPDANKQPTDQAATTPKEVEVYGQDGSWIILNPDKGPAKEVYVKKGQKLTVPFSEKLEIRLGNPSSVVFRYGGKETPVTTEKGETKTLRFP